MVLLENASEDDRMNSGNELQIGALVKMYTRTSGVFGMVSGLTIPIPSQDRDETELKMVEVELVGEALRKKNSDQEAFQRGISFCPTLGTGVYTTSHKDLKQVYARPAVSSVQVGHIYQDQTLPAFVATDDLLGKHFAVLGTTGSGKSCAVALILRSILNQHNSGHVLLLDLHNEYGHAFADCAEVLGPAGEPR